MNGLTGGVNVATCRLSRTDLSTCYVYINNLKCHQNSNTVLYKQQYGGYYYGVVVLNLFIMVLCGFVYFCMCGGVYVWVLYCMDV